MNRVKTAHIVGAGEFCSEAFRPAPEDLIIAADGGLIHCARCDLAVGDFDSLGRVPEGVNVVRHPVMKDETDMLLAADLALERGCGRLFLHGGTGGRPDHTMANYHVLAHIASQGAEGYLVDSSLWCFALRNARAAFPPREKGTLSVFAWGGPARGVTIEGLLYPLQDGELTPEMPLGVSNEFTGHTACISVTDGTLLVFWPGDPLPVITR